MQEDEAKRIYNAILKYDRISEEIKPSGVPIEQRLETLPGQIFIKDTDIYRKSSEIEELKPKIKNMEMAEINKHRDMTVDGVKPGTKKPKYTVERAEFEAKSQLAIHDKGYKILKEQEKKLHIEYEMMKLERIFLENSYKAARTLAWLKVGDKVQEAIG